MQMRFTTPMPPSGTERAGARATRRRRGGAGLAKARELAKLCENAHLVESNQALREGVLGG